MPGSGYKSLPGAHDGGIHFRTDCTSTDKPYRQSYFHIHTRARMHSHVTNHSGVVVATMVDIVVVVVVVVVGS